MKLRHALFVLALTLLVLAAIGCSAGPTATPVPKATITAPPPPTLQPTQPPATPIPVPTFTPAPPSPTPVPAQATAKQLVNLRQGPGVQFAIAGKMPEKTAAAILGKSEDSKWYQVALPDKEHPSWVSAAFVDVSGPADQVAVVAVAPPPTATPAPAKPKTATTAPVAPVPPAKGLVGFVSYDNSSQSFVLNNITIDARAVGGFKLLGRSPFDLAQSTNAAPFAWSPDGSGRVAWIYGPSGVQNTLMLTDRAGNDRALASHQGISSPSWSPDGTSIAYVGMDNNFGTQFIYKFEPEGPPPDRNKPQRFFSARMDRPESFRGVAWGKAHLAFVSNYTGQYEIWRLNTDGSGPLQITNDKRENGSPAWSPDGTRLTYYSRQTDGSYQIMIANADGTNVRKLTNAGNNFTPTWSQDGNWIAFASTRGGRLDVYMMDKNGNNVQPLTDKFGEGQLPGSWR